jgi:mannose-6-phosphate isomerase
MQWHPLRLTYHVRTYAFGARLIPDRLGKQGVPAGIVAETWEVSDYRETTATIVEGPFAGRTLHEVTLAHPDELVGEGWRGPHFPLLAKFLDASHMLPVHLHADDATAKRVYGEPNGKTEAWHILWCADDASILAGVKPGAGREELIAAFKAQDYDRVMPRHPIRPGQTVYVPGGVLHSFGPDSLIFEIQQTSDLGQNVMPTDLYGNRLDEATWDANIERTLAELKTDVFPKPHDGLAKSNPEAAPNGNRFVVGAAGPHFALERWTIAHPHGEPPHPDRCLTLSNLGDRVTLAYAGGVFSLGKAESCLVPAALGGFTIVPDNRTVLIACYVPDLARDVVAPLREAGHDDRAIAALGETLD